MLVTVRKPVLIHDCPLKAKFVQIYLMSFSCPRIPPGLSHDIGSARLLGLLWDVAVFWGSLAPVALPALGSTGQVFCRRPRCWDLSAGFLTLGLGFWVLEGRPQDEVPFHPVPPRVRTLSKSQLCAP